MRLAAAAAASVFCAVGSAPAANAADGPCANAKYRTGPSLKLPDCRAYELVTPADKFDQLLGWPTGSNFMKLNAGYVPPDGEGIA